MADPKDKKRFCMEHYDTPDEEFRIAVAHKNWLADPLVQELFRRLLDAPGKWEALAAENMRGAAEGGLNAAKVQAEAVLSAAKVQAWAESRKRMEPVIAVEEAVNPIVANRRGPKSKYVAYIVKVIRSHGPQPKGALVKSCLAKWPDNRVAISNSINRELKYKDGRLKEQPHNKFIALRLR